MEDLKDKIKVMGYDILGLNDVVYVTAEETQSEACALFCEHCIILKSIAGGE